MTYEQPPMDDARIDVAALLSAIVHKLPRILLITLEEEEVDRLLSTHILECPS